MLGRVAGQKTKGGRKNNKISKSGPTQKADSGKKCKGKSDSFFMMVKTRGNKSPDLEKNYRAAQKNSADKG